MALAQVGSYEKTYISSATTTQVFTGPGTLHAIVINTTAAGTIGIIDGTSGTTVNVGQIVASAGVGVYEYNIIMKTGCRIVTGAASDITVTWTQGS